MPALGPRTPSVHIILCLVKLHQDGKRAVSREAGSESSRSGTNMCSHRAGAVCTLILHEHGLSWSRGCLHTASAGKLGQAFCLLCFLLPMCQHPLEWSLPEDGTWWLVVALMVLLAAFPWFLVPDPNLHLHHHDLLDDHVCSCSSNPFGPHRSLPRQSSPGWQTRGFSEG